MELGQKDICRSCGKEIIWKGRYWEHVHYTPRHPGLPSNHQNAADPPVGGGPEGSGESSESVPSRAGR